MRATTLLLPALLLLTPAALAQTDNRAESDRLFDEGLALANKGDFDHARVKFAAAYAKFPSPNSLLNLAKSEQLSGHCVEALPHFRAYVALPANPRVSETDRAAARGAIGACRQTIGTLVIVAPPGTAVYVDGAPMALSQQSTVEVEPGQHQVKLGGDAGLRTRAVTAEEGKDTLVEYEPKKTQSGAGTPQPHGGETPPASTPAPHRSVAGWVVPVALGVVGLSGVGVGIGAGAASFSAANDADALRTPGICVDRASSACAAYTDKLDSQNTLSTVAVIGYVTGGVCLAGAIAAFVAMAPSKQADHVALVPVLGTDRAGFAVTGRF